MITRVPAVLQPLRGALLGLCGCGLMLMLPRGTGAVAAVTLWTVATMAQGERGFAGWIPGLPLFGSLLGGCTILLRWYALISLQTSSLRLIASVTAATALGPAASIALAWISRPADDAAVRRLSVLTTTAAVIAIAEGVAAALLSGVRLGLVLVMSAYILLRLVSAFVNSRFAGVRGSDLEAFRVVVETAVMIVLASIGDL